MGRLRIPLNHHPTERGSSVQVRVMRSRDRTVHALPSMGRQTTAEVLRGLKSLKRRLARHIRADRMILFGSRPPGDWLLTSDADLMIVSPDFEGRRFVDRSAEVLRHWRGRVDLEVFCYTPEEVATRARDIGIVAQALKDGRRI